MATFEWTPLAPWVKIFFSASCSLWCWYCGIDDKWYVLTFPEIHLPFVFLTCSCVKILGLNAIGKLGAALWIRMPCDLLYPHIHNSLMTLVWPANCLDQRLVHLCKRWHKYKSILPHTYPLHNTQLIKCLIGTCLTKLIKEKYAREIMSRMEQSEVYRAS